MSRVVCDFSISADGFAAGTGQSREHPFGAIEHNHLHDWMFQATSENQAEIDAITRRAPSSWGATCSAPTGGSGTWNGKDGGGTTLRITVRCSCLATGSGLTCRWREAPSSDS